MKELTIKCVDAFTTKSFAGNPAGVIAGADGLSPEMMQLVASQMVMNIIEYGFVGAPHAEGASFAVRYFTPKTELGCSGHVTIAICFSLIEDGMISLSDGLTKVVFETRSGLVPIDIHFHKGLASGAGRKENTHNVTLSADSTTSGRLEKIMMHQPVQQFRESEVPVEDLARVLGIEQSEISGSNLPVLVVKADIDWLIIPVKRKDTILEMHPDLIRLAALNKEHGIQTNHIFTTDTFDSACIAYARHFGPAMGLWEDPATAMAAGGLGTYLVRHGMVSSGSMMMEQGNDSSSLARLHVEIDEKGGQVSAVRVGGLAATSLKKMMRIESGEVILV